MRYVILLLVGLFTRFAVAQVTFIVNQIPAQTPVGDAIFMAGSMNGWDAGSPAYQLVKDSLTNNYLMSLPAGSGTIEFKFTRGAWTTVEGDANGAFRPNRTFTYGNGDTVYLQILGWEDLGGGQTTAAANVRVLSDSLYIPQLNRYRRVWLYLPPDYALTSYRYPVLYMHDGQNVFDANTSFSGEWEVDETLNALHADGDSGIIVVAVDNGGNFRLDEYSPWVNPNYGGGQGDIYLDFLAHTLKPYIDSLYRTLPDPAHTGLLGSSMGGLISLYGGLKYQQVFGRVGAFSPAYWFAPQVFDYVTTHGKTEDMRFYQLMGAPEGAQYVSDMWQMEDSLLAAGFTASEIKSKATPDGAHSEWFWAREFEDAYLWLFRNPLTSAPRGEILNPGIRIYPNPASNEVCLALDLAQRSAVSVELFDAAGRKLCDLFEATLPQGPQRSMIDMSPCASAAGMYYFRIRLNGRQVYEKLPVSLLTP